MVQGAGKRLMGGWESSLFLSAETQSKSQHAQPKKRSHPDFNLSFFLQNRAWPSKGWVESWGHIGFGVQRELEVRN